MPKLNKRLRGDQIKELSNLAGKSKCSEDAKRAQALLFLDDGFTEEQLLKYVGIGKSAAYKLRKKYGFQLENLRKLMTPMQVSEYGFLVILM